MHVASWGEWNHIVWQRVCVLRCLILFYTGFYSNVFETKIGFGISWNIEWTRKVVTEEKPKMSQPIKGQDGHAVFPIGPKNTNLVEDI